MRSITFRAFGGALLALSAAHANAATFTVTKTADTNDGTCNADCSLREAVRAANAAAGADTITIPAGQYALTIAGLDDVAAQGDLDIQSGSLTINGAGAGQTVISSGVGRVFHVDPEGNDNLTVSINGLTARAGTDTFGGVIFNLANLSLSQVHIADGVAGNGGGLFTGAPTTIVDSTFSNNRTTTNPPAAEGFGGGILVNGTTLTLSNTGISGNVAARNAGAIYAPGATVTVSGGTFLANSANNTGGGLEGVGIVGKPTTLTFTGTTFTSNSANDGGAISLLEGATVRCTGCTFTDNRANGTDMGGGGAIFNYDGVVELTSSTFNANRSKNEGGGAIENAGDAIGGRMTIANSTFTNNVAFNDAPQPGASPGLGGAILVIDKSQTTITDTTFDGNDARLAGGALYVDRNATVTMTDTDIINNQAETGQGGGILSEGNVNITRGLVDNNLAASFGGGISHGVGTLNVTDSEISDNTGSDGGAIGSFNSGTLVIRRSALVANTATGDFGGGILFDSGVGRIENTLVSGNAARIGGAVSNNGAAAAALTLSHVTLVDNTASAPGGGTAMARFGVGTITVRGSIVAGNCNTTMSSGGGNLSTTGANCGLTGATDSTVASIPLDPLSLTSGTTSRARVPAAGSVAIDFVAPAQCLDAQGATLAVDQRSFGRPFDGDGNGVARCDAGAAERKPQVQIFSNGFE